MEFVKKLKGFLLKPKKSFKAEQKTSLTNAVKYGLIGFVVLGILTAIFMAVFGSSLTAIIPIAVPITSSTAIMAFFAVIIFGFIGLIISGLWLHLWVYVFGGRKGIKNTIKTVFYAYSPAYLLGWIPIVSFIAKIWYLVLAVIGLTQMQKLSTGRAIGAVVVAIIIPLMLLIAIIIWAISILGPDFLVAMEQLSTMS